jgi:hypothetical protein
LSRAASHFDISFSASWRRRLQPVVSPSDALIDERFGGSLEDEHFVHRRIQIRRVCERDEASVLTFQIFVGDPTGL